MLPFAKPLCPLISLALLVPAVTQAADGDDAPSPAGLRMRIGGPARQGDARKVRAFAFTPDGKSLVTAGTDRMVKMWDVAAAQGQILYAHHGWVNGVAVSPDGRFLASCGRDQTIRRWDLGTKHELPPLGGYDGELLAIAFSPDGRTIAAAGRDAKVRLWECASAKVRGAFSGHRQPVASLTFAPDGRSLVSTSLDGSILVWDVTGLYIGRTPPSAEERDPLWSDLAGDDAARAYQAVWRLSTTPKETMALIKPRLRALTAAEIDRMLIDLDSPQYPVRKKAKDELTSLGKLVEPNLKKVLANRPSLEVRRSIDQMIKAFEGQAIPPHVLRVLRTLEVLEIIGTPEAREVVQTLATGAPDILTTQEAQATLARWARRAAVP